MTPLLLLAGWALIHFLWQGLAIAGVACALLAVAARRSAGLRYVIGCASLVAMLAAPAVTARLLWIADRATEGQRITKTVQREGSTAEAGRASSEGAAGSRRHP